MRVAQVNLQRDWGGAERHVLLLSKGLHERGEQVSVCCHPRGGLFREAQRIPMACTTVAAANQVDLAAALRLAGRLFRFRPEIIHVHTPKDYLCGFLASRILPGAVLALTRHMVLPVKPMMRRIYSKAAVVICLSSGIRDHLEEQGIPTPLLRLGRSGIDTAAFGAERSHDKRESYRQAWSVQRDDTVFGTIGRLVTGKGYDCLLQAAARVTVLQDGVLDDHGGRIKLVFIGEGPERGRLERQAQTLGVSHLVYFAGFSSDIPGVLAALDGFVLASEGEMLPLSVMEAMAAGLPVVATAVGGIPELVEPEVTGLLVPPRAPAILADSLMRLAERTDLRRHMGARGQERARRDFTISAMVDDTIQAYRDTLGRRQ
jgi:glycosyltransferase involved in cell wall biosynthesis